MNWLSICEVRVLSYFHSVTLDKEKCHGCTNCIKRCPTEAIRVGDGKAKIIKGRCIDCGECIRVCPYHAKRAVTDSFDEIHKYKHKIALPAPAFYGQFNNVTDINVILTGLLEIGFDDIFEVARGAEYVTDATKRIYRDSNIKKPYISSACPAVVRLIRVRFPNLVDSVIDLISPMELAARLARKEAKEKTGLSDEDIGVFFITPCPAKMTSIKSPLSVEKSAVNGAISVNDIFGKLLPVLGSISEPKKLMKASLSGVSWSKCGGESEGAELENYIAVDGIENVINILEDVEDDKISDVDFIELSACLGGCVGGVLNVINGFIAKKHLKGITKKVKQSPMPCEVLDESMIKWSKKLEYQPVMELDKDLDKAMEMMDELEVIYDSLPKLDCGSCGAPSCKALAEDIVRGFADDSFCIVNMKAKVNKLLASELMARSADKTEIKEDKYNEDI